MIDTTTTLFIITSHVFNATSTATNNFSRLLDLIKDKPKESTMVILGDFNAHIGRQESVNPYQKANQIGKNFLHSKTNSNGEILIDLIKKESFRLDSSFGRGNCKVTWRSGKNTSQIDHIMTQAIFPPIFNFIQGESTKLSDHKIILGNINNEKLKSNKMAANRTSRCRPTNTFRYKTLNYALLQDKNSVEKYQQSIKECMSKAKQQSDHADPLPWEQITEIMQHSAS